MIDPHDLEFVYKQNLEVELIAYLAKITGMDELTAMRTYYKSLLACDIDAGRYGIQYLDAKYLVGYLMETEPGLFTGKDVSKPS